ncbi:MAG: DMT family transporter [Hyphomicrobiaceae bacterium]|nr:MAG: DMT family transporter [Hyphomicrobiaceae bacterium]
MPTSAPQATNRTLLGILYMCIASSLFPVMNGLVQVLSARYSSEQIVWARTASHLVFLIALFGPRLGVALVKTTQLKWQVLRSVILLMSTYLYFNGVKHLPLAEAASISFSAPFIVALLAWPALGERIPLNRLLAVAVAFLGVLVVIRPGSQMFHWASLLILGNAVCYAVYQIVTRRVSSHDPPETSAVYSVVVGTLVMSTIVPFVWINPLSWMDAGLLFSLGILGGLGHYCVARALSMAQANFIAPFGYWQMVGSVIVGYMITGLLPDLSTWIGAGIIICAGIYIAWRETRAGPAALSERA